jgi:hypothetical protein
MLKVYILYGFGILLCLAGIGYLAAEAIELLSATGKLLSLLLAVVMFAALGRYFEIKGW